MAKEIIELDSVSVRPWELNGSLGTIFTLSDGAKLILEQNKSGYTLSWPITDKAKKFLVKASKAISLKLPDQFTVTDYNKPDAVVGLDEVDNSFSKDMKVETGMSEAGKAITWYGESFLLNNQYLAYEGQIKVPNLQVITSSKLNNLITSTAHESLLRLQDDLLIKLETEINRSFTSS